MLGGPTSTTYYTRHIYTQKIYKLDHKHDSYNSLNKVIPIKKVRLKMSRADMGNVKKAFTGQI